MTADRRRRRPLTLVVALAAVAALGSSAQPVGAERQTTITFGSEASTVISLSSSGDQGNEIALNFAPSAAPLPQKFVIQVPTGYALDLTAKPGTEIADGTLSVSGVDSPSFAAGYGEVVVQDPAAYSTDPVAQACAPGVHAAVWALSISLAGQKVNVSVFVDPGGDPGVGYTLQSCPTGLGEGGVQSAASLTFAGLEVTAPKAVGRYVWHTFVTPHAAATYELQAVAPLPGSLTLRGRYDAKRKSASLTGKLIEGGKPAARRRLFLSATTGSSAFGGLVTQTRADGTFSFRMRIKRTTEFTVSVAPSVGPCEGTTTAPGGCLGAMTVPPDSAATTVRVRARGEAVRAIRAVDQRLAERENFATTDFPPGFEEGAGERLRCADPTNEADLTITGESQRAFLRYVEEPISFVAALGLTRVYATRTQAASAFAREAVLATVRCELGDIPGAKIGTLRLRALPARVRAYRATFSAEDVNGSVDMVFLQRGRSVARLLVSTINDSLTIERAAIAKVASRMR